MVIIWYQINQNKCDINSLIYVTTKYEFYHKKYYKKMVAYDMNLNQNPYDEGHQFQIIQ